MVFMDDQFRLMRDFEMRRVTEDGVGDSVLRF